MHRKQIEQERDEELCEYLAIATEQKIAAGMRAEDALRAARVEMGSPEALKDRVRDVGWESVADTLGRDVQYAVRLMALTIIGSLIGVALAAGASRLWAAWLLGVPPLDPVAFMTAVAMSMTIGLAACYVPARRAAEVDPMIAVRSD